MTSSLQGARWLATRLIRVPIHRGTKKGANHKCKSYKGKDHSDPPPSARLVEDGLDTELGERPSSRAERHEIGRASSVEREAQPQEDAETAVTGDSQPCGRYGAGHPAAAHTGDAEPQDQAQAGAETDVRIQPNRRSSDPSEIHTNGGPKVNGGVGSRQLATGYDPCVRSRRCFG